MGKRIASLLLAVTACTDPSSMTDMGSGSGSDAEPTPLPPVDDSCHLDNAAFCDAFAEKSPGGRGGDLDDSRWSFTRLGYGCSHTFAFPETPINLCGVWKTVTPGGPDSQFCTTEDNDPRWTEGFEDNTDFQYISARIRQPFDFEGRTGTFQWEADARTSGSHGWWTETWFTADPIPGPNLHDPDQMTTSKEALGIVLDHDCSMPSPEGATTGSGYVGVSRILQVHDWVPTHKYDPFGQARCVKTEQGKLNTFHVKLSKDHVEVWASDAGSDQLRQIAEADLTLPFTRAYAHVSHVHYNAEKVHVTRFQSYQWARIAFDGPQLPIPRAYQVPDSLSLTEIPGYCGTNPTRRVAYGVTDRVTYDFADGPSKPAMLVFPGVDVAGATKGRLTFNTAYVNSGETLSYRFNGGQWRDFVVPAMFNMGDRSGFSVPVTLSDLVPGNNRVEFGTDGTAINMAGHSMHVANIDLELEAP